MANRSISQVAMNAGPPRWVGLMMLLFIGGGLAGAWALLGKPLLKVQAARQWQATPCRVVAAIERDAATDGDAAAPPVLFSYVVDGREYSSTQFSFFNRSGFQAVPSPASARTCYVNPDDPADAVLDRGVTPAAAWGLIPLGVAAVGTIGFFATRRRRRGDDGSATISRYRTPPVPLDNSPAGMVELRPSQSPLVKLIVTGIFALFWNGIVSVFIVSMIGDWGKGPDACGLVFMTPFALIGLAMIAMTGYFALSMFNPRPILAVSARSVGLGESIQIRWTFTGRFDRIGRLRIGLTGQEEATYTRGTSTTTDRSVFYRKYAVDTAEPVEIYRGEAIIPVPADTMHSFNAPRNKIVWQLLLHGEISGWPDVKETYPIEITPVRQAIPRPRDEEQTLSQEEAA